MRSGDGVGGYCRYAGESMTVFRGVQMHIAAKGEKGGTIIGAYQSQQYKKGKRAGDFYRDYRNGSDHPVGDCGDYVTVVHDRR